MNENFKKLLNETEEKTAQNIDNMVKKENVGFGTEIDFADELPEEFPQELAGMDTDELADIYTNEIMNYLASDRYDRETELVRKAVAEMQAEQNLPAEDREYDYLDDIISILKKPQEDKK